LTGPLRSVQGPLELSGISGRWQSNKSACFLRRIGSAGPPGRNFTTPRHHAPEFCEGSPSREGAGNAGCALHPRSRVQDCAKNAHTSIQVQRRQSGIPCAMALRLMPCSPRRRIRLVTVAAGLMADQIRLDSICHRQLDTSNGCRNHTVLPYAAASFVWRAMITHRPKPALRSRSRPTLPRPPHPAPTFVTMANAPQEERDGGFLALIWGC
jgi:hypothetical protein